MNLETKTFNKLNEFENSKIPKEIEFSPQKTQISLFDSSTVIDLTLSIQQDLKLPNNYINA